MMRFCKTSSHAPTDSYFRFMKVRYAGRIQHT